MAEPRSNTWKWSVCGLLLLASAINYLDRQTLANASIRITRQFSLSEQQYGNLEFGFGWAFALGSLLFGYLVDRFSVRWVYPVVLALWSTMGILTGFADSYGQLLGCRILLGLFEAGHWPCAVKTTQRLLEPKDRSMGNGVLQAGTSVGAILSPLIMRALLTEEIGSWRPAFIIVGAVGFLWIFAWFAMIRPADLAGPPPQPRDPDRLSIWRILFSRRMLVILAVIALINTGWQILRAWLPKFLVQGRGYAESEMLWFSAAFYVATDVGVILAGAATLWLHKRGASVHDARKLAFLGCALMSASTVVVAVLPRGGLLLALMLVAGAGALGVFPIYHALTQELSAEHQGKVSGFGGLAAWALSPAQSLYGYVIGKTGSFDAGFALTGCLPLLACGILWLFWDRRGATPPSTRPH